MGLWVRDTACFVAQRLKNISGGKRSSQTGLRRGDREVRADQRYLLNGLPPHSGYSLRWDRGGIHTTLAEPAWFLRASALDLAALLGLTYLYAHAAQFLLLSPLPAGLTFVLRVC